MDSVSSSDNIGEQLIAAGWRQGSLLPALSHAAIFLPGSPASSTSRSVRTPTSVEPAPNEVESIRHAVAIQPQRSAYRFVVISQTCDIARESDTEPFVDVAVAQFANERRAKEARSSVRLFLLDESRYLIVNACYLAQVEKPLLLSLKPEQGPPDDETARRFRFWLGDRRSRPAFPDGFIKAVRDPMRARLRELREQGSPLITIQNRIRDVRTLMPPDMVPYPVQIVVLLDATDEAAEERAFKDGALALFGELLKVLDPDQTHKPQLAVALMNEMPVNEYLASEPLDFGID